MQAAFDFTEVSMSDSGPVSGTGTFINEAIHGHDKAKLIQAAIGALPVEQRQAIELAYFSGLTQDEISQKSNTPLGTIKAHVRRGLLKLRDQLEGRLRLTNAWKSRPRCTFSAR